MSSISMETIASMNNEAILLFQSGKSNEAVKMLTGLLPHLKSALLASSDHDDLKVLRRPEESNKTLLRTIMEPESLPKLPIESSFIYNKAFKLFYRCYSKSNQLEQEHKTQLLFEQAQIHCEHDCNVEAAAAAELGNVYTAFILYNLAVLHQNAGMQRRDSACLYKATTLYQMCLKVTDGCCEGLSGKGKFEGVMQSLKAVSFNNLAQIYSDRGESEHAEQCLSSLCRCIVMSPTNAGSVYGILAPDCPDRDNIFALSLSPDELDELVASIFLKLSPSTAAGAA
jgi:tetratricopeptide (TPR) repeat protein